MLFLCLCIPVFAQASESGLPSEDVLAPKPGLAAAKMDSSAPSVIILPPRFRAPLNPQVQAAAELACDRLAQEIATAGLARVVDRQQVDRVLQEHGIAAKSSALMLSYDVMVRMEVNDSPLSPETRLSVIELSTGNVLKEQAFGWPLKEADVAPILAFCRQTLKFVTKPSVKKLRVRTLWAAEATPNERIRPLARRLIEVFEESLKRSDRVMLVQHLEAATAKEESLLLLMGMSRLPGGRQFTPQADATIELRVGEGNGQGKTFSETPIEIGVRLCKGANYQGDWATTAGLVRDFDAMIPQAWQKLSQSLREVRAETATTLLNEMSLRRKQADRELQIIKDLEKGFLTLEVRMSQLKHAEAALKLDPTNTEAVRSYVRALGFVSLNQAISHGPPKVSDVPHRTIVEASHYLDRFRPDSVTCSCLCEIANQALQFSSLYGIYGYRVNEELLQPISRNAITITPELKQELDAVKRLLERGIDDDVQFRYDSVEPMAVIIYHGMRLFTETPLDVRLKWLDAVQSRCADKIKAAEKNPDNFTREDWLAYFRLQCRIVELFMEDGQIDRAKRAITQAQSDYPAKYKYPLSPFLMRAVIKKLNDARVLADYERWLTGDKVEKAKTISPPQIEWPLLDIFAGQKPLAPFNRFEEVGPHLTLVEIRGKRLPETLHYPSYRPLAEGGGRLYFLTSSPQYQVGYVPLDQRGGPIGKATPNPYGTLIWDNIQSIPQPDLGKPWGITSAGYIDGKLIVGTNGSGLHVFDAKTKTWKRYGPEQGLPSSSVEEFVSIGDHLLYCRSGNCHCTLNMANDAITLVGRSKPMSEEEYYGWPLRHVWRNGNAVMALCQHGIWKDLFGKERKYDKFSAVSCHGWTKIAPTHMGVLSAAEVNGRRFYLCLEGLHEFDANGCVIQSWWLPMKINSAGNLGGITITPDCPIAHPQDFLGVAGSRLVLVNHSEITVYDVTTDTWYGPLQGAQWTLAVASGGIWGKTHSGDGLIYLALGDLENYAKSAGRAMTSGEFSQRKQRCIDAAKPLDRAKYAISMKHFAQAELALRQVLEATPDQPEALFLMKFLHDGNGPKQADEALNRKKE